MTTFTPAQLEYLRGQRLGRLATVDRDGAPQNNPVGFFLVDDGSIEIGGRRLAGSRKFRNILGNERVALVIDDMVSVQPWQARGVEIRGRAQALTDVEPPMKGMSRDVIRIIPERIISWGVDSETAP